MQSVSQSILPPIMLAFIYIYIQIFIESESERDELCIHIHIILTYVCSSNIIKSFNYF